MIPAAEDILYGSTGKLYQKPMPVRGPIITVSNLISHLFDARPKDSFDADPETFWLDCAGFSGTYRWSIRNRSLPQVILDAPGVTEAGEREPGPADQNRSLVKSIENGATLQRAELYDAGESIFETKIGGKSFTVDAVTIRFLEQHLQISGWYQHVWARYGSTDKYFLIHLGPYGHLHAWVRLQAA
jgi:hypothetical protein